MARSVPEDGRSFAAVKLGNLPYGTRLVLAWDPHRWLPDDEIVDGQGRPWRILTYDGNDLQLAALWRTEGGISDRAIIRASPPAHDRKRTIDLSYLDWLIADVEHLVDLSIGSILSTLAPGEAWHAGVADSFADMIGQDLRRALLAYRALRERIGAAPLAEPHIRAMAVAASVKGLSALDVLFATADPVVWLRQYLRAAMLADTRGVSGSVRDQARLTVPLPSLRPWIDADVADVARLLYAVLVLRALKADPDPITVRGLAILSNPDPLLEALSVGEQSMEDAESRENVVRLAEKSFGAEDVDRMVSVRATMLPSELASVVSALPPLAGRALLRREMLAAAALADPLSFIAGWRPLTREGITTPPSDPAVRALNLLKSVVERLEVQPIQVVQDLDGLIEWYVKSGSTLEYDVAAAQDALRQTKDQQLRREWDGILRDIRSKVRGVLDEASRALVAWVGDIPKFLQRKDLLINVVRDLILRPGRIPPRVPAVWLIVFDGARWDTWDRVIRPLLEKEFEIQEVRPYLALLPSTTGVSRTSLVAGQLPSYWRGLDGQWTRDEHRLGARLFDLKSAELDATYRFRTRADVDVAHEAARRPGSDSRKYNVLIYNVSDEWLHDYRKDVYQLSREVERTVREVILPDMLTFIGEDDVVVISSDHGFVELDREDAVPVQVPMSFGSQSGRRLTEGNITYRYLRDIPGEIPNAAGPKVSWRHVGAFTLAMGHQWFQRPGQGASFARYSHGGISLEELVVPAVRLTRSAITVTRLEWREWPRAVSVKEDEPWEGQVTLVNSGNRSATFEVRAQSPEAAVEPATGTLRPRETATIRVRSAGYPTSGRRRLDIAGACRWEGGEVTQLPLLSIPVEVAERAEKVVFGDALDLLDDG